MFTNTQDNLRLDAWYKANKERLDILGVKPLGAFTSIDAWLDHIKEQKAAYTEAHR